MRFRTIGHEPRNCRKVGRGLIEAVLLKSHFASPVPGQGPVAPQLDRSGKGRLRAGHLARLPVDRGEQEVMQRFTFAQLHRLTRRVLSRLEGPPLVLGDGKEVPCPSLAGRTGHGLTRVLQRLDESALLQQRPQVDKLTGDRGTHVECSALGATARAWSACSVAEFVGVWAMADDTKDGPSSHELGYY